MGKKVEKKQVESESSEEEENEMVGDSESDDSAQSVDSDVQIKQTELNEQEDLEKKFGLKAINDEAGMLKRL